MRKTILLLTASVGLAFISISQEVTTLHFSVSQSPCTAELSSLTEIQPVVSVFPNPSAGKITVSVKGEKEFLSPIIKVSSLVGETILLVDKKKTDSDYKEHIDLSALPCGIYFVDVNAEATSSSKIFKIVINH